MKLYFILVFLFLFHCPSFGQSSQDSSKFFNNKFWFTFSGGPSIGINKAGPTLLLFGPGIDFNWITNKYHYVKIKTSAHFEFLPFDEAFQKSLELNLMTGKLIKANQTDVHCFTFGIGVIGGIKKGEILHEGGSGGSLISFSHEVRSRDPFIFIGIPLEYKSNQDGLDWEQMQI